MTLRSVSLAALGVVVMGVGLMVTAAAPAFADRDGWHEGWRGEGWHEGWRGGGWHRGWHGGPRWYRDGWREGWHRRPVVRPYAYGPPVVYAPAPAYYPPAPYGYVYR